MSQRVLRKRTTISASETHELIEITQKNSIEGDLEKKESKRRRTHDQAIQNIENEEYSSAGRHRMRTRSMEVTLVNKQSDLNHLKEVRHESEIMKKTVIRNVDLEKEDVIDKVNNKAASKVKKVRNKTNSSPAIKLDSLQKFSTQPISTINKQLEAILKRLDNNEIRFKEQLHHLNQSMEQLKEKVMEEIPNKIIPSPDIQRISQEAIQTTESLSRKNEINESSLKHHYSDYSQRSFVNLNHDENESHLSNSVMTYYKLSQDTRSPHRYNTSRRRQKWTEEEVIALIDLVSIYGPSWSKIKKMDVHGWLQRRTQVDLKDKARIIKQHLLETPDIWHQFVRQCGNWEAVSVGHSLGHRGVHSS
ncbi:hypothetical protein PORY_002271 [Pneumocystis oryctolagi]|uniref:Uncharacterized protein n=1 Tax=Pneumocystis oryctolagi TaxID=42067 RepID=A0ACB7C9Q0_9ASCO|nr:hypothetical protein PORY_002271 [Pneumocystis oryctolagi]